MGVESVCVHGYMCVWVFMHVCVWEACGGVEWRRETSDLHPAAQCMCFLFVYKGFQLGSDWKIILLAWTFFLVVSSILSDCWIPVLEWISPFPLAFRLLNRCVYIYIYIYIYMLFAVASRAIDFITAHLPFPSCKLAAHCRCVHSPLWLNL